MSLPRLPKNDGWYDQAYDFGNDADENARVGAILNLACHVFHCHAGGTWVSHDKDTYARKLAVEIRRRAGLAGRLLATDDRVVKMVTHRALELVAMDSVDKRSDDDVPK